jgi:hypothetical protein
MDNDLNKRINRAKELLATARHAAMATVNEDGSPHNTPFVFMHDPKLEYIYWGSHPESLHSKNILRTGQIYVVLYDAIERGGLYMSAENGHSLGGEELERALVIHNQLRAKEDSEPLPLDYYASENSSQKMWGAKITHFWVNGSVRDTNGRLISDNKQEITVEDLLK